jgi:hypothetical protein
MQFPDPQSTWIAHLILRHLYDGDVIEWPIEDAHPHRMIFAALEQQGYVARWDRIWPLSDRYRLTERGIAAIEAVYRPAGAEAFFEDLRRRNMPPAARRAFLQSRQLDPTLWPLLHDPSTHWSTFATTPSRYVAYIWEDRLPPKRRRPPAAKQRVGGGGGRGAVVHHVHHRHHHERHHVVDLDREAGARTEPHAPDYDVS